MPGSAGRKAWFHAGHFKSEKDRNEAERKLVDAGCEIIKKSDEKTDFLSGEPGKREQIYVLVWKEFR